MNVYSNAFNFSAHLNGQVDPRTGQYGCQVRLTTLYPKGRSRPAAISTCRFPCTTRVTMVMALVGD